LRKQFIQIKIKEWLSRWYAEEIAAIEKAEKPQKYRKPDLSEFIPGFEFQAFIGGLWKWYRIKKVIYEGDLLKIRNLLKLRRIRVRNTS